MFNKPTNKDFLLYLDTFREVLDNTFGKQIIKESHYYSGNAPLVVLLLKLDGNFSNNPVFHNEETEVEEVLEMLDSRGINIDNALTEECRQL